MSEECRAEDASHGILVMSSEFIYGCTVRAFSATHSLGMAHELIYVTKYNNQLACRLTEQKYGRRENKCF